MMKLLVLAGSLVLVGLLAAPASAESVGLLVGASFQTAQPQVGGATKLNLGASFDLTPKVIPVRVALVFDYAGGSANGASLSNYGAGLGVRIDAPVYGGVNMLVYNVSLNPGGGLATASRVGLGTNYFVGERIARMPGGGTVSVQATYRQVPTVNGINPSGLGVALRLGL
jgi:hypothetical protein